MTYKRTRNQELSIKIKPTTSSSNILYEPDFIFNDVKQYLEKKYSNKLLIDSQEKVGIDFFTKNTFVIISLYQFRIHIKFLTINIDNT